MIIDDIPMRKNILSLLLIALSLPCFAQIQVRGSVKNSQTQELLLGVSILENGEIIGITNLEGQFLLTLETPSTITMTYVGYEPLTISVDKDTILELLMVEQSSILDAVVVTGSQTEKDLAKESISIELIQPQFLEKNYINTLEQVMERTPGVQILDGQVNIRSSGFAQGSGSRVGILLEGQPLLNATYATVPWDFVPIENISQIEVLKGAASVLYGAAALNGVINVREAMPTNEPYTSVALYGGFSDSPQEEYKQWWNGANETPGTAGVLFAHRQKWGKLDVVVGGNAHQERGYIQGNNEERYRVNFSTRYRATERLTIGLRGNAMDQKIPAYFLWMDADTNILQSSVPLVQDQFRSFTLDPYITYIDTFSNVHKLKGRFFNTTFVRQFHDNTPANVWSGEYIFQRNFKQQDWILTAGVQYQNIFSRSPAFGTTLSGDVPEFDAEITALYGQVEKDLLDKKLNLIGGIRWEWLKVSDDFTGNFPIFRLSATYKLQEEDILRASFGQGYRLPSLAERYIDRVVVPTDEIFPGFNGLRVVPNPSLKPEFGYSSELGYKRIINVGSWQGYADIALFWMEYNDLANFVFDLHVPLENEPTLLDILDNPERFGFSTININRGRIAGYEVSSYINGTIGGVPIRFWGGYTYTYPADLDSLDFYNQSYLPNLFKAITLNDKTVIPTILNYRSLHIARLDTEVQLKPLTLGFVANYNGYIINIDPVFLGEGKWGELLAFLGGGEVLPGVNEFRNKNISGTWIFDARLAWDITDKHRINFIVQNVLNQEYSLRIGRLDPLRSFNIKYQVRF